MGSTFGTGTVVVVVTSEIAEGGFEGRFSQAGKANTLTDLTTIIYHIHPSDLITYPHAPDRQSRSEKLLLECKGKL